MRLDIAAASPPLVIEQLAAEFTSLAEGPPPRALAAAAIEREAQASTFLGHNAALPHARLTGMRRLAVAFGRTREPVIWTPHGDPVRLVFLGAVPADQPRHYLEFMRALGRALHDDARAAALLSAPDETSVRAWLKEHVALA